MMKKPKREQSEISDDSKEVGVPEGRLPEGDGGGSGAGEREPSPQRLVQSVTFWLQLRLCFVESSVGEWLEKDSDNPIHPIGNRNHVLKYNA